MEGVNHNNRRRRYGARDKDELINTIIKLHEEGYSQVAIAKKLDISRGTILRWNKELQFFQPRTPGEAGKLKNKIYNYDEDYFQEMKTANQAYLAGYILGDGTIVDRVKSKRIVLCLAEKDRQLLQDIACELRMSDAIKFRKKSAPNEQNKYSLVINSTKMADDLIKLGITPNKTGKERFINFDNKEVQWAFLRGFFDADGHIRVFRQNGYLKARMGFTGNREMLLDILAFLRMQGFAEGVKSITEKQGCFDLYIGSIKQLREIYYLLYQHGDIKLNRKYEIFSSLMR
ncbi:LAGLIDADG family homing endonuclease [Sporosarcina beigongshangi]|uniref:LAGLIDADG family homing endonuclease n=1 Tax=Sporosarcina beigongshangi TaxID=2782538 RepID=UPI001E4AEB4A|nr:LAGLIDADG family homing endonuclease [Sporosarcina beigongshangi]